MSWDLQTCRFCGKQDGAGIRTMVKYGVRHYAHFACYLDAGKPLSYLSKWQVGTFPFKVLKDRGLLDEAERLTMRLEGHYPRELLRLVRGESA